VKPGGSTRRQALIALLAGGPLAAGIVRAGPAWASSVAVVYVPETGHHLQLGFLDHWRRHQGPARLGYPLTEEHWDAEIGGMVQYFQHARLEWRPEEPGAIREVPLDADRARVRELDSAPVSRQPGVPDWSTALAPPPPAMTLVPEPVRQGRTLFVEVHVDDPAAPLTVSGTLGVEETSPLPFFSMGGTRFAALTGVATNQPPGELLVTAHARNGLGLESSNQSVTVGIADGGFSFQQLTVAPHLLELVDPEVREQERLTLATVVAESRPEPLWRGLFLLPVDGPLTTTHGARRAYLDPAGRAMASLQHAGVDLAAPAGTPVAAPGAGVVAFTGTWSIRGNVVVLDHGAGVHSVFAHLASIAVSSGQAVSRRQMVGRVGSTGLSTGPHLHWEIRVTGVAVEPLEWTRRPELALA
jgi:hypothetical protein